MGLMPDGGNPFTKIDKQSVIGTLKFPLPCSACGCGGSARKIWRRWNWVMPSTLAQVQKRGAATA